MANVTCGDVGMKFLRDVREHEHHEKEVEGVERPAKEACRDDVLLLDWSSRTALQSA